MFTDRVIAALVILRFQLPHAALAVLYGVDRCTITRAVHEIRPLLAARGFAVPGRPDVRLRTLADVFAHAAAEGVELRLDGTESGCAVRGRASPADARSVSGKMRQNTKKTTVVTDEKGRTLWAGAFRPGRIHDQTAVKTEGSATCSSGTRRSRQRGSSQCKVSSVTLMRRLSSNSRKNQIYKAFREVGRVMRTVALLRFLADSGLRARVTAATNKADAYNGFSAWTPVRQPGRDRRERPGRAGKVGQMELAAVQSDRVHTAIDMMEVIRQLVAEGWRVTAEDLAQLSPYLTSHILRFGAPTQPTNSTSRRTCSTPR
ncbi:transposase [Streptomyces fulvoviolaceus]|uniref:transposase n=1 Tax=Streptomyces fulvoviolaceus TaxID=285535 RepID=UPI0021BE4233|nr:transposase [Streptomyces fulvoviolaceus]MCT9077864.1 transposase [Streptomyces fulvoviolaceus]